MDLALRSKKASSGRPKVMAVVGKSALKKASERNLLKRRLRALLLPEARRLGRDLIVVVRGRADGVRFDDVRSAAAAAFKKYGNNL